MKCSNTHCFQIKTIAFSFSREAKAKLRFWLNLFSKLALVRGYIDLFDVTLQVFCRNAPYLK